MCELRQTEKTWSYNVNTFIFQSNLQKDVEELKGIEAAKSLDEFMEAKELPFIKFSSGIYTWPEAHAAILKLLDGNNGQ